MPTDDSNPATTIRRRPGALAASAVSGALAGLILGRLRRRAPQGQLDVTRPAASHAAGLAAGQGEPTPEPLDARSPDVGASAAAGDAAEPDSPIDLTKPSLAYVLRKTVREFASDQCTDLAAALTYYAVLSVFPALVVMVSLLGVFGQGKRTTDTVLQLVGELGPGSAVEALRTPIEQLVDSPSAGFALLAGILGALWSASGYVGAFGRAMNRVYEIDEGRPIWKLRPLQLLITMGGLIMAAAVAFMLAVSGPVASAIGNALGLGDAALTAWNIARWAEPAHPR